MSCLILQKQLYRRPEAGCAPVTVKAEPLPVPTAATTPTVEPKVEASKPAQTTTKMETVEPEPKDYAVNFSFQVTYREKWATDFCDERVESYLDEGDDIEHWTCIGELVTRHHEPWLSFGARNWTMNDMKTMVTKSTYEDLKPNTDCKVSGAKLMKCSLSANYITVQARAVNDMNSGRLYQDVTWEVYYWPDSSGY